MNDIPEDAIAEVENQVRRRLFDRPPAPEPEPEPSLQLIADQVNAETQRQQVAINAVQFVRTQLGRHGEQFTEHDSSTVFMITQMLNELASG